MPNILTTAEQKTVDARDQRVSEQREPIDADLTQLLKKAWLYDRLLANSESVDDHFATEVNHLRVMVADHMAGDDEMDALRRAESLGLGTEQ